VILSLVAAGSVLVALFGTAAEPSPSVRRIVAFGDSTTAPRKVAGKALKVYADVLGAEALPRSAKLINAGVPSNTTRDARARFSRDVLDQKPDTVIIQFGINDATVDVWQQPPVSQPRVALQEYSTNLTCFVAELRRQGARAILMTPNPMRWTEKLRSLYGKPPYSPGDPDGFNVLLRTYAQAMREVARQTGVALVDVYATFQAYGAEPNHSLDDLLLDGMHPNDKGHRLIADLLRPQLEPMPPGLPPAAPLKRAESGLDLDARLTEIPGGRMGPFVRLKDGRLLTLEGTNCLTSGDDGRTWQSQAVFAEPAKFRISDERAIIRTRKGVLIAAFMNLAERRWTWDDQLGNAPGAVLPTCVMRSTNEGATWEVPRKLHDDWTGAIREILETRSGRVVFTSMKMRHNPGRHTVLTYSTDDQGVIWRPSNVIDLGGAGNHDGVTEATIVELKDGRLLMLLRTNWGRFWLAESTDGGLAWHPLGPSDIPASSSPSLLRRLQSGRIVLVWNRPFPEGQATYPMSGGDRRWSATPASAYRGELSIAFSNDDCRTWSPPVVIARNRAARARLAYPYLFEASPGELWLTTMQGEVRLKLREADF